MRHKPAPPPNRRDAAKPPASPKFAAGTAVLAWAGAHSWAVVAILLVVATARIVATYPVFNHTIDEPAHIACGMEWLSHGTYTLEVQHPPLSRVAAAFGPYLAHVHSYGIKDLYQEGAVVLYWGGHYDRNLALARLGILPFFWIATLVVYLWARRASGEPTAVLAALLFTFLPPILAHSGLATTDMALTAFTGASFLAGLYWIERPDAVRSAILGACLGLAVLSKFTALAFIPVAMGTALAWHFATERPAVPAVLAAIRQRILPALLATAVGIVVIWAGYRFSLGMVPGIPFRMPAPELFAGIHEAVRHNSTGHPAYLLGMHSDTGWWYYFPIVLAVKTPLPFLALLALGAVWFWRDRRHSPLRDAIAFSGAILAFCLFSHINIGVRHILPVYMGFSIVAASAAARLAALAREASWARWTLGVALFWMIATSALAHPDYLPYFNAIAGNEPERILVDSDLDWGQDMKRLAQRLKEAGAREVTFNPFIVAYLEAAHGFPHIEPTDPQTPTPGWDAVSLTVLKTARLGLYKEYPDLQLWPDTMKPTERVGKGVLLYYIPPPRGVAR